MPRQVLDGPEVLVVIPTRDRPKDIDRCLASLATVNYPAWEILVLDQSDDDQTQKVAMAYQRQLPQLSWHRLRAKGLSRARNVALRQAGDRIVAFLDDDCTVEADWLSLVAEAFAQYPDAGIIFGTVKAAPHDARLYHLGTYDIAAPRAFRRRNDFALQSRAIGASMYLWPARFNKETRRFDAHLGAGTPFFSAEDVDFVYRAMLAGDIVVETPTIAVLHWGMRDYASGAASRMIRAYAIGMGAMDMKFLRSGDLAILTVIVWRIQQCITGIDFKALITRRGPAHTAWLAMYLLGMGASFRLRVNRRRLYAKWRS